MKNLFKLLGSQSRWLCGIALAAVIAFVITACPSSNGGGGNRPSTTNTPSTPTTPASGAPSTPQSFNDITAAQLVANIKIGWNLGNTLDAPGETSWGNPRTTKAMITAVKNAGFNAIRIPVSWNQAVGGAPNYTIRANWMARVVEIVNYAADNNMYIILNSHHDENIFKFTNAGKAASLNAFTKTWAQIADTFKNYNEKLIFEGLNEPRTIGSAAEWNGGTAEEHANLNEHYQAFVNTVRASGGNNDKRILMVNTYAASAEQSAMNGLKIPDDTADKKIIVSIHAYAPYNFALNQGGGAVNTWSKDNASDTSGVRTPLDRAYTAFVSKGFPVIMGEFGVLEKRDAASKAEWAEYYVGYARSKGIPCFWWDDGGDFRLFNRSNLSFYSPAVLAALMKGANE